MSEPLVSVIIPNFNKGKFVRDCIRSVSDQTYQKWELVFVDDGSTDGSDELAAEMAALDERILFKRNTGEKGASSCRNQGLAASSGRYILFLDSDDLLRPDCLERRVNFLQDHPELDYAVFPMGIFHKEIGDSDVISNIPNDLDPLHRFLDRDIVWLISGPIWKRQVLEKLDGFDEELHSQQDYDLHVRALIAGFSYKYLHVSPDVYYRQEVHSIPRLNSQTIEHFQFRFEMILRHCSLLKEAGKLGDREKLLLARYLLDLGQMMRWHIAALGKEARKIGLLYWRAAKERELVPRAIYDLGIRYIRFKHNMKWNRFPRAQRKLETFFRKRLGPYIFYPSKTYCKVSLDDYEG